MCKNIMLIGDVWNSSEEMSEIPFRCVIRCQTDFRNSDQLGKNLYESWFTIPKGILTRYEYITDDRS